MKPWIVTCIVLFALALFFFFGMRGYTYISYALLFLTALILVHHLGSPVLRRIVAVVTCIGLVYFCFLEFLILSNAQTDRDAKRSYLIVLGASVQGDVPSLSLQHRLEGALD